MTFADFRNALSILKSLDKHELERAGVDMHDDRQWVSFRTHPSDWLLRACPADQLAVWGLVQMRAAEIRRKCGVPG
jgi:hypothetical protein